MKGERGKRRGVIEVRDAVTYSRSYAQASGECTLRQPATFPATF